MDDSPTFVGHVFLFDEPSKCQLMNLVQYGALAAILLMLFNRLVEDYEVDADDKKGSMSILFEILLQCIAWLLGIFFIHRIITFLPTLSKTPYEPLSLVTLIVPTLLFLLCVPLQPKTKILLDRLFKTPPVVPEKPTSPSAPTMPPILPTQEPMEPFFQPMQTSFSGTAF